MRKTMSGVYVVRGRSHMCQINFNSQPRSRMNADRLMPPGKLRALPPMDCIIP